MREHYMTTERFKVRTLGQGHLVDGEGTASGPQEVRKYNEYFKKIMF